MVISGIFDRDVYTIDQNSFNEQPHRPPFVEPPMTDRLFAVTAANITDPDGKSESCGILLGALLSTILGSRYTFYIQYKVIRIITNSALTILLYSKSCTIKGSKKY